MEILCRDACDGHHVGRVGRLDFNSCESQVVIFSTKA